MVVCCCKGEEERPAADGERRATENDDLYGKLKRLEHIPDESLSARLLIRAAGAGLNSRELRRAECK